MRTSVREDSSEAIQDFQATLLASASISEVIQACKEDNQNEVDRISMEFEELQQNFLEIFDGFYKNNEKKLNEAAGVFSNLVGYYNSEDNHYYHKLVFALYISNSVENMSRIMGTAGFSVNFRELVTDYLKEDGPYMFGYPTEGITMGEKGILEGVSDQQLEKIFLTLKKMFILTNSKQVH